MKHTFLAADPPNSMKLVRIALADYLNKFRNMVFGHFKLGQQIVPQDIMYAIVYPAVCSKS